MSKPNFKSTKVEFRPNDVIWVSNHGNFHAQETYKRVLLEQKCNGFLCWEVDSIDKVKECISIKYYPFATFMTPEVHISHNHIAELINVHPDVRITLIKENYESACTPGEIIHGSIPKEDYNEE